MHILTDFRLNALWKLAQPDAAEAALAPFTDHHPVDTIKGLTRYHVPGDLMHTGDLGVCAYTVGGVLAELVYDGPFPGALGERVLALWREVETVYQVRQSSHKLSALTLSMFYKNADAWVCFSGKAAETRCLLYVVKDICEAYNTGSDRDLHRLRCLTSLCGVYDIFQHGHFLPREAAENAMQACDIFLVHYNWLCNNSVNQGRLYYPLVVKLHMFWHICHQARWLNPRTIWAYEFEDQVGAMITSAKACTAGTPMRLIGTKALENYRLVLNLRLNRS